MNAPISPDVLQHILRRDFRTFLEKAFEVLEPGRTFAANWHHDVIAKALTDRQGWEFGRLIINMPPRSLKSLIISVAWPAFLLGQNPATGILAVSYSEALAAELSMKTRRLMTSDFYLQLFPGTRLAIERGLLLETPEGGQRIAASIGGTLTGRGGDWVIIDDPLSAGDAWSGVERQKVNDYFDSVLQSRLDDPSQGNIVVVAQRLHEDDLSGHLIARRFWDVLTLPALATEEIFISEDVGGRPHRLARGEPLHPERMSKDYLERLRLDIGSATFQAQYQQTPLPAQGAMIRAGWLMRYAAPISREGAKVTLSVDTATKTQTAHDFSACSVWYEKDGRHHVVQVWRDRVDYPDLKRKIIEIWDVHRADHLLIEDQGSGSALIQELTQLGLPAVGCKSRDSKEARLSAASSYIEAGRMWLPEKAAWLGDFEAELLGFPNAKHDDQVDTVSQYFAWVRDRPKPGVFNVFWT